MSKQVILPTLLTLGNAVCGLAAIAFASKIGKIETPIEHNAFYLALSGYLILFAMVFDTLDGYAARLARSTSAFGAELDSLCDAVSFGAAPAFLLLQLGPSWDQPLLHRALATVAAIYLLAVILRLAHYNVEALNPNPSPSKKFRGLPSPAAAGCLASLAIVRGQLGWSWPMFDSPTIYHGIEIFALVGATIVSGLMVSSIPYPHLTKHLLRGRPARWMVPGGVLLLTVVLLRDLSLVVVFWAYALASIVQSLRRIWRREPVPVPVSTINATDEVLH